MSNFVYLELKPDSSLYSTFTALEQAGTRVLASIDAITLTPPTNDLSNESRKPDAPVELFRLTTENRLIGFTVLPVATDNLTDLSRSKIDLCKQEMTDFFRKMAPSLLRENYLFGELPSQPVYAVTEAGLGFTALDPEKFEDRVQELISYAEMLFLRQDKFDGLLNSFGLDQKPRGYSMEDASHTTGANIVARQVFGSWVLRVPAGDRNVQVPDDFNVMDWGSDPVRQELGFDAFKSNHQAARQRILDLTEIKVDKALG